ncbi:MAG: redoxin domain-containing protein [Bacteroidetes bacterium]|nr:redoxin domain-containing protein [Bacteroidota bacterium]
MKKYIIMSFAVLALWGNSCTGEQSQTTKTKLAVTEFAEKMKAIPNAPIVDVRTPDEFSKGHLQHAKNIDWNGDSFDSQISSLDKSKPVLVYCLSGARSGAAASKMRADGFKEVYELQGGILKWKGAEMPITTENSTTSSAGISKQKFDELINSDKLVLIDFYAEWCTPCKKMKPYLEEIAKEMSAEVVVISINVDDNLTIANEMKINEIPLLHLYKNKTLVWNNTGFIDKESVLKIIQSKK